MKYKNQGFTLIELMIVVAVVGILSAIAYPSYTEYIRRGHRADARAGLLQAQLWMERAATAMGTYPTNADKTKVLPDALSWKNNSSKRYEIGLKASTDKSFTLIAKRKSPGPQAGDKCGDLTLSHTGDQGADNLASGASASDCWSR
ncbi:type IV pilin protein [Comamonas composti]|uniref:type IV pilin protein n=1 Tax=Comamonas composti TaxID=408558 RepID=UPI00041636F6|nr:type IV pilin protein [Comamonas composti]